MKCIYCGTDLPVDAQVCHECGMSVLDTGAQGTVIVEEEAGDKGKVLGVVAMILGIVSAALAVLGFGCCCCPYTMILVFPIVQGLALIVGIVGFILSLVAKSKSKASGYRNKKAVVGMILSIVGVVVSLAVLVFIILYVALVGSLSGLAFLTEEFGY